jgi:hypothetical protein
MATQQKNVDTFVMPASKAQIDAYKRIAESMTASARKHGRSRT